MKASTEMIRKVLKHLVSPKWSGIVEYDISVDKHDDTGVVYSMIDVVFDIVEYWLPIYSGVYKNSSDMDEDISADVRKSLKYLGISINNVIVEIYVRNEDGIDN
jgi:hypothetical protein